MKSKQHCQYFYQYKIATKSQATCIKTLQLEQKGFVSSPHWKIPVCIQPVGLLVNICASAYLNNPLI